MQIEVGNKRISSIEFTSVENAWRIKDAFYVLEYFNKNGTIVLGGDILTENFEYTYDNWYYNIQSSISAEENGKRSVRTAVEYIRKYIGINGEAFYVVFVTK